LTGRTVLLWRRRGSTAMVPRCWGTVLLLLCAVTPSLCSSLFSESFPPLFCSFGFSFSVPSLCSIALPSLSLPFSSSPKFCPSIRSSLSQKNRPPFLFVSLPLFISRKRRSPPCSVPSWCRGGNGMPYLCRVRWPAVCMAWCPSLLFITLAGYVGARAVVSFMQVGGR
jgi:hypothetical protein